MHRPPTTPAGRSTPIGRLAAMAAAAAVVASLGVLTATSTPATAGTGTGALGIEVTTTIDLVDPADGLLSLREAVDQANADGDHSQINLQPGATYPLTTCAGGTDESGNVGGDLDHTSDDFLIVEGNGATVEQTCNGERVLHDLDPTSPIVVQGLTITGGRTAGSGGGLFAGGHASISDSVIEGNVSTHANGGGGVAANLTAGLERTTVRDNVAAGRGGGVRANEYIITLSSTIEGNVSGDVGGGLSSSTDVAVQQSTVSGNRALVLGGGVHASDAVTIQASTLAANGAPSGANVAADEMGAEGSVIALGAGGQDCDVPTISQGGGTVGYDASCDGPGPDDAPVAHPMLAPLADNGGPTQTMALVTGSPALDATAGPCLSDEDQRGEARPDGPGCDSGAFEGAPAACAQQLTDVPEAHPFFDEICWLAQTGITGGYGDGSFGAANPVSRQAMAAFLYRLALSPPRLPTGPSFSDVPTDHPFFAEIEWLNAEGIATGYPDGTYHPVEPVTRQAMAAFLFRVAGEPAIVLPGTPTFSDVPAAHPFYEQIEWMAAVGVSTGYEDGTWNPGNPVTRQAMAAFLQRMAADVDLDGL